MPVSFISCTILWHFWVAALCRIGRDRVTIGTYTCRDGTLTIKLNDKKTDRPINIMPYYCESLKLCRMNFILIKQLRTTEGLYMHFYMFSNEKVIRLHAAVMGCMPKRRCSSRIFSIFIPDAFVPESPFANHYS